MRVRLQTAPTGGNGRRGSMLSPLDGWDARAVANRIYDKPDMVTHEYTAILCPQRNRLHYTGGGPAYACIPRSGMLRAPADNAA
jgi:hypothetical protein